MNTPEQWRSPDRVLREHTEWWADHIDRRMQLRDPTRPPWEGRAKFLRRISDYPGAEELAAKFEDAVAEAHGNAARFRQELAQRLGEPVTADA